MIVKLQIFIALNAVNSSSGKKMMLNCMFAGQK
jgi:hypothetical protein